MPVRVQRVGGKQTGFRRGDEIIAIDGTPVADQLDVIFLTARGQPRARFTVRRGGVIFTRTITARGFDGARLEFEPMRFIRCRSKCIFCFMDQMPRGMRSSLYEKDDDYRLSFLFGNYVTLGDLTEREMRRIIDLGLSPLYISVHAIDKRVRARVFGRPLRRSIEHDMERLARHGIIMHAQIVVVPGVNDGRVLNDTVERLFRLYPECRSVALVPVGLTKHRKGLPRIRSVSRDEARAIIDWASGKRRTFLGRSGGRHFVHLSDEFYLLARRALPPMDAYDDFPQLANGVGMCRLFLDRLARDAARLASGPTQRARLAIITGALGARFMRRYVLPYVAEHLPSVRIDLIAVVNRLFGRVVGVSGLLAGADIQCAVQAHRPVRGCLVIPPNALNHDGLFLDDMTAGELGKALGIPVVVPDVTFLEPAVLKRCRGGRTA
jgi:putative radical SAM enzyme (TIGR03279 family)